MVFNMCQYIDLSNEDSFHACLQMCLSPIWKVYEVLEPGTDVTGTLSRMTSKLGLDQVKPFLKRNSACYSLIAHLQQNSINSLSKACTHGPESCYACLALQLLLLWPTNQSGAILPALHSWLHTVVIMPPIHTDLQLALSSSTLYPYVSLLSSIERSACS